ncbi:MAG: TolC family protein [Terriglobales bacterium]|jgi:outer membrane protein TolC|nr:TolC family protein [Terriglobales bacterium]
MPDATFGCRHYAVLGSLLLSLTLIGSAQTSNVVTAENNVQNSAPLTLTLQDALQRAKKNNPEYRAALTEYGSSREDVVQSRAALLPNVNYNAAFDYTQGGGALGVGRFIANNGVHEYISLGDVHQAISLGGFADYRRSIALEALARARAEIAARGLVVTVTQSYYGFVTAQRKFANEQRAATQSQAFFDTTQKLENGGEVAHSDVIKSQLQMEQVERDLRASELEMNRTRIELAILVFPDFNENFAVVDDLQTPEPLPSFAEIQTAAANKNPELRAAVANLQAAKQGVASAWNGVLPSLSLDYLYGIDANHFAVRTDGIHNLGYAATATLQLPIWNWGASRAKLKQAGLRQAQANLELTFAQRQLLANMRILYDEAQGARAELDSLNRSAELASESLRLTGLRYKAGEALVLEVVDAQNTLTQALNALNDGQVRFRVAMANLQTITGSF